MRVMVELAYSESIADAAFAIGPQEPGALDASVLPALNGVAIDADFPATALPGRTAREQSDSAFDTSALFDVELAPEASTYLVRGEISDEDTVKVARKLAKQPSVVGVYSDPVIEPQIVCPGSPPVGTDADVERLLCTARLRGVGADGGGVLVAIVDTGVNLAYLNAHGKNPGFDGARSWVPRAGLTPGSLPVGHGTMCAFDVCIAAPRCTLLDVALLQSNVPGPTPMSGVLSDAVRAYRHLIDLMAAPRRPGENRSLVVNNSWGMFHPSWDFPVGDPGNYSDNPNHPFNRIVAELERAGADILFAAGNCGANCPDGRCQGVTANAIYGANGHAAVLCVAGVDTTRTRVGYSTIGPGRLTRNKPDIAGYTHFRGSGVYAADGGTSAATPVVAGVVAAVRSQRPFDPADPARHPAAIRTLVTSTAEDLGPTGYDLLHGYGVVNGCRLADRLDGRPIDPCVRYPWLCRPIPWDICRRHPWLCRELPRWERKLPPRIPPIPVPPQPRGPLVTGEPGDPEGAAAPGALYLSEDADLIEASYLLGLHDGASSSAGAPGANATAHKAGECDCGGDG